MTTADAMPTSARAVDGARPGAGDDWDWEAFQFAGRLYLYCYLRETVRIPLTSGPAVVGEIAGH